MRGSKNLLNLFRSAIYRRKYKDNSFPLYGLELVIGEFGSGKTLTCVDRVTDYLDSFPDCRLCTNVEFFQYKDNSNYYYFDNEIEFLSGLINILSVDNDKGCIVLIDEVRGFLSKTLRVPDSIPYNAFFTVLSQVRKLHCLVLLTSQIYSKVQKVLRDYIIQNGDIVLCKKLLPGFTYYMYYDMSTIEETSTTKLKGKFKRYDYLVHSPELYSAYDSKAVVSSVKGLLKE